MKNIILYTLLSLGIMAIFVFLVRKRIKKTKLKRRILKDNDESSVKNIVDSISKSKTLYKELITSVHPDKFQEIDKKEKATDLASRITKSKKNYENLVQLKIEVLEFLDN